MCVCVCVCYMELHNPQGFISHKTQPNEKKESKIKMENTWNLYYKNKNISILIGE